MLVSDSKKVVLDTSVLISGIRAKENQRNDSSAFRILRWFEAGQFLLMMNGKIMDEYQRVLDEQAQSHEISGKNVGYFLQLIRHNGVFGSLLRNQVIYNPRDPSDNIFFLSSNCISADYLVTLNDRHFKNIAPDLLKLNSKLKITSPDEFVRFRDIHGAI